VTRPRVDRSGATNERAAELGSHPPTRHSRRARDERFQPLESKLRPHLPAARLIERRRLLTILRDCPARIIALSAPAGAGKSTVLMQWAACERRPVAWLHLDRYDNDPAVLLVYLAIALSRATSLDLRELRVLDVPMPSARRSVLPALANHIGKADPFLLVLDDAHLIENPGCWDMIEILIDNLPPDAQVALGTRALPPLQIARLKASEDFAEFDMSALALDRSEVEELLRNFGLKAKDETVRALLGLTEGWATGLTLAALACNDRSLDDWLPHIRGDQSDIAEYLTSEILENQLDDVHSFLLETSILDRLSPAICRSVSGRADAAKMLEDIAHANVFLVRLDDRRRSYRYHHLFAEYLQTEFGRVAPVAKIAAHRKAATWYRSHGAIEQSVRHSLLAGDTDDAADLVSATWTRYIDRGHLGTAANLLTGFTEEQIAGHTALAIIAGWLTVTEGASRMAAERLRAACTLTAEGPSFDGAASLRSSQLLLRTIVAPDGIGRMHADAAEAMLLESGSRSGWRANALVALGTACWMTGATPRGVTLLEQAAVESRPGSMTMAMASLSLLALALRDDGHECDAARAADAAFEIAAEMDAETRFVSLPAHLARAQSLADRNDPEASISLRRASAMWTLAEHMPWMRLLAAVIIGEVHIVLGDLPAARRWADTADAALAAYSDAGILRERVERLRAAARRDLAVPITPAELRILRLLPTHLSTSEIAARLFVSPNTVKTEISSVYRKLEASSRTEAVEAASDLGLIDPETPAQTG
jgi:LuxR family transcriptional regulator, maltose regulon positive regulatory protein